MKLNLETLQNKIVPVANKVQSNTYLSSIMDGMSGLLAPILVGAIATLLNNLPFEPYQAFLETIHIKPYLAVATNFTTDIIALFAVFLVAYNLVRKFDMDGVIPGVYAIVCFLVLTPLAQVEVDGEMTNFISFEWLGAAGLFVAIILGLVVGRLYVAIVR
ncbi:MAG: PTS transporter subunit EIIC, partial [Caldibacillus sp.]